jgi:hypothetical protein
MQLFIAAMMTGAACSLRRHKKEAALVRAASRTATKRTKRRPEICWKVISSSVSAADLNFPMHRAAVG